MLKAFSHWMLCGALAAMLVTPAWSQDEKKDPPKEPASEQPAEEKKPEEPAESAGPAAKQFVATYDKWKEILKQLRAVRTKYQAADEAEQAELKKEWDTLIGQADAMIPDLRKDAMAAYSESPNLDATITRFLVKLLSDEVARDEYEAGAELADLLIKNDCDLKQIYRHAGVIAFVMEDYAKAEEYLNKAVELKVINPNDPSQRNELAVQYLQLLPEYKELWEKEKALREAEAKADDLPRVKLETSKGTIVIELFENEAPDTVGNFVSLVEKKFYDGLVFHRVLPNFMAQGGDPKGDGTGGPGYSIFCECDQENHRNHFRGTLSMAHSGPNTGGSQFFMTFVPTAHLNGKHTAFGRIIEGMDVLAKLQRVDPSDPAKAATPDKIVTAEVIRKRDHEYQPKKVE